MLKRFGWRNSRLLFINALLLLLAFGSSPVWALSHACALLNENSGTSYYAKRFAASDFDPGETLTLSFLDNGDDPQTSQMHSGHVRLSSLSYYMYYAYSSYFGEKGRHSYMLTSGPLRAGGLYIELAAHGYLSDITISCRTEEEIAKP